MLKNLTLACGITFSLLRIFYCKDFNIFHNNYILDKYAVRYNNADKYSMKNCNINFEKMPEKKDSTFSEMILASFRDNTVYSLIERISIKNDDRFEHCRSVAFSGEFIKSTVYSNYYSGFRKIKNLRDAILAKEILDKDIIARQIVDEHEFWWIGDIIASICDITFFTPFIVLGAHSFKISKYRSVNLTLSTIFAAGFYEVFHISLLHLIKPVFPRFLILSRFIKVLVCALFSSIIVVIIQKLYNKIIFSENKL